MNLFFTNPSFFFFNIKMSEFWLYDTSQLFNSFEIVPKEEDSFEQKLNTITRLSLLACLIISAYSPVVGISTFLIIIAILSAIDAKVKADTKQTVEGFEESNAEDLLQFMKEYNMTSNPSSLKYGFPTTQTRFCNDEVPLMFEKSIFPNETLRGSQIPKTTVPPIVATPSHDMDWRANDFVTHSATNARTNYDSDRSGYHCGFLPTRCKECIYSPCQCKKDKKELIADLKKGLKTNEQLKDLREDFTESYRPDYPVRQYRQYRPDRPDYPITPPKPPTIPSTRPPHRRRRKDTVLSPDSESDENDGTIKILPCFETPQRDNLLTQTLQPGVFQKSHIGEPIQSNIGISFTQNFTPTGIEQTNDKIKFTQFTPESVLKTPTIEEINIDQSVHNVYDPRFSGYGTHDRSYVDKMGRPQYFYDDINSITMPNLITRNNVDVFPWASTYGPDVEKDGSDEYRQLANNAFTDSTIRFRTELQERLMRKRNAEMWQRRAFPISTMNKTSYLAR